MTRDYNGFVARAEATGCSLQVLGEVEGFPVLCATVGRRDAPVIYVNGGTHGDEPAGVEAALGLLEGAWERWADHIRFDVIPCLNPWAYVHNTRLNAQEVDINWAFKREDVPEVQVLKRFIEGRQFASAIDLHEDWESVGFYVYEMFHKEALGEAIVDRVVRVCPLNENAEIEGEIAVRGVIHPSMEVAKRAKGEGIPIALFQQGYANHLVTTETPTEKPIEIRVAAHLAAVEVIVEAFGRDIVKSCG